MKGRHRLMLLAVAVLAAGWAVFALFPIAGPQRLLDGTLVELTQFRLGSTNQFRHGSRAERVLGDLIPTNGIHLAGLKLDRPETANFWQGGASALSVQFRLSGPEVEAGRSQVMASKFYRQFRLLIVGDDGFVYVEEFERNRKYRDGIFVYVSTTAFPRSSKVWHFRLQHHDSSLGPWRTVAEFVRRNPARAQDQNWTPEQCPVMRTNQELRCVLGEVTVKQTQTNAWENFWQNTITIPLQVFRDETLLTNWVLQDLVAEDSSGNSLYLGTAKTVRDGWVVHETFRSIDPSKVWHVRAGVSPESAYAATNLFTMRLPIPLGGSFPTNLGGYPLRVGFVNTDMLSVDLLTNAPELRLAFVGAWDEQGKDLNNRSGSWGQFRFWRSLNLPSLYSRPSSTGSTITATIAISPNVPVAFTVRPRLLDGPR